MKSNSQPQLDGIPAFDDAWLRSQVQAWDSFDRYAHSPSEMLQEWNAYTRVAEVAARPLRDQRIDWDDLLSECNYQSFADVVRALDEDMPQFVAAELVEAIGTQHGAADAPTLASADRDLLMAMVRSPTKPPSASRTKASFGRRNGEAEALALGLKREWQQMLARWATSSLCPPMILRSKIAPSYSVAGRDSRAVEEPPTTWHPASSRHRELWVQILPDSNNIERDAPDVYVLSALLVEVPEHGSAELLAAAFGQYVSTAHLEDEDFFEVMDAHSQMMNDVWKVVTGTVMPDNGARCVADLMEAGEFFGIGLLVPAILVPPARRGANLSAMLLDALHETIAGYDGHLLGADPLTVDNPQYARMRQHVEDGPIALIICPVAGTPPRGPQHRNIIARDTTAKLPPRQVVDLTVERERIALTRYFTKIGEGSFGRYLLYCYNPWDFPWT